MVGNYILTTPCFLRCPVTGWSRPKWIIDRQAKGQEGRSAEIETASVDIIFRHADLTASIAYAQSPVNSSSAASMMEAKSNQLHSNGLMAREVFHSFTSQWRVGWSSRPQI